MRMFRKLAMIDLPFAEILSLSKLKLVCLTRGLVSVLRITLEKGIMTANLVMRIGLSCTFLALATFPTTAQKQSTAFSAGQILVQICRKPSWLNWKDGQVQQRTVT